MEASRKTNTPRPFRMTRKWYHFLDGLNAFERMRVELLEGSIFVKPRLGPSLAYPIQKMNRLLVRALPDHLVVRTQLPFAPGDEESEPEPDFAIVPDGEGREVTSALLAIEITGTSLRDDLQRKARIYARAGIPEYWVVDVKKRELIVHRAPSGEKYRSVKHLKDLSEVTCSSVPGLTLDLRNIFIKR